VPVDLEQDGVGGFLGHGRHLRREVYVAARAGVNAPDRRGAKESRKADVDGVMRTTAWLIALAGVLSTLLGWIGVEPTAPDAERSSNSVTRTVACANGVAVTTAGPLGGRLWCADRSRLRLRARPSLL